MASFRNKVTSPPGRELTLRVGNIKILVFSDTHLTRRFERQKCDFLLGIINEADLVVINGDFWEGHMCTFEEFIASGWKTLFPALLRKNAIYIHGNHDAAASCGPGTKLFSKRDCESCTIVTPKARFIIEHGHRISQGKRSILTRCYLKSLSLFDKIGLGRAVFGILLAGQALMVAVFGNRTLHKNPISRRYNQVLKSLPHDAFLICGDSHCPELDLEARFGNTGSVQYGIASYLMIENGVPRLVETAYPRK